MSLAADKYINPFTDYGFKKIFGEEPNKDLLLDFLNELLKEEQGEIIDLTYLKTKQLGISEFERKAIFDLYCENEKGEKFIVELQKTKQNFFKDRSVYYTTFPIREQAKRSNWNFQLNKVYLIAILDFTFESEQKEEDKYQTNVLLKDTETNDIFYDKLEYIFLEMPRFNKKIEELETRFDKWLYVIKNLNKLDRVPDALREQIFEKLFEVAEIAKFTMEQADEYEDSLKSYRDLKNSLDTSKEEGREEGREEGLKEGREEGRKEGRKEGREEERVNIAKGAIKEGLDNQTISNFTGLSEKVIEELRKK